MDQNRMRQDDVPNRAANRDPAEGARDDIRNSGNDLGSASDRAMFDERMDESQRPGSAGDRSSSERSSGSSGERNQSSSGGISNRGRDREQREQDELPDRGQSQSER
jgi:hypothetical protein